MAGKGCSDGFRRRLDQEIRLALREMRDGCPLCIESGGYCPQHHKEAMELILSPRRHLRLSAVREDSCSAVREDSCSDGGALLLFSLSKRFEPS